jgi:hypothetical protein
LQTINCAAAGLAVIKHRVAPSNTEFEKIEDQIAEAILQGGDRIPAFDAPVHVEGIGKNLNIFKGNRLHFTSSLL